MEGKNRSSLPPCPTEVRHELEILSIFKGFGGGKQAYAESRTQDLVITNDAL